MMLDFYVSSISINHFRNYRQLFLCFNNTATNFFYGTNGSGKTNILEALSIFSNNKGLRNAKFDEMQCSFSKLPWAVTILTNNNDQFTIGIDNELKRRFKINGNNVNYGDFSKFFWIMWITPKIDIVLAENTLERRKFFDNLVSGIFQNHSNLLGYHKALIQERIKILSTYAYEERWINQIETSIAETSLQIHHNRLMFIDLINNALKNRVRLELTGEFELRPEINVIKDMMKNYRQVDTISGGTVFGIQKTNWNINFFEKNAEIKICSTGEQKITLIDIFLETAKIYKSTHKSGCLVLLDEIFSHLDHLKIKYMVDRLEDLKIQSFFTATDVTYKNYFELCNTFEVANGVCLKC